MSNYQQKQQQHKILLSNNCYLITQPKLNKINNINDNHNGNHNGNHNHNNNHNNNNHNRLKLTK